eukprot:8115138-Pyramimonas_sp.AAC.1
MARMQFSASRWLGRAWYHGDINKGRHEADSNDGCDGGNNDDGKAIDGADADHADCDDGVSRR